MPDAKISELSAATTPLAGTEPLVLVQSGVTKKIASSYFLDAANLTGSLAAGRMPAHTGDVTSSAGAVALTLATVNSNVGSFGSATASPNFTVNAKGLITAAGSTTITPAWSSITSKPTTLSGYSVTAADVLATLLTVDGAASALDSDLLDGQHGSYYRDAANLNAGTILAARMPALTGDATSSAGAVALTLATVNSNVGSFGSATAAGTFTVNAKGLITAASSVTITPAWSSITSKPTTLAGYGITNAAALTHSHAATDITSGTLAAARMPALTGDVTTSAGAVASTLATVNSNVGSFGSATQAVSITVNAKGLVTAASHATITPAWSSITSKPTTIAGYGITDAWSSASGGIPTGVWHSSTTRQIFYFDASVNYYKAVDHQFRRNSDDATNMTIYSAGNVAVTGDITAYSSDSRLKENVAPIADPLAKIARIGGYTFDWKRELVDALGFTPYQYEGEHGFLAQEIADVVPDAVRAAHFNDQYLTVKYERVIPLAIEGIKALKVENDELRDVVAALLERVEALELRAS